MYQVVKNDTFVSIFNTIDTSACAKQNKKFRITNNIQINHLTEKPFSKPHRSMVKKVYAINEKF